MLLDGGGWGGSVITVRTRDTPGGSDRQGRGGDGGQRLEGCSSQLRNSGSPQNRKRQEQGLPRAPRGCRDQPTP